MLAKLNKKLFAIIAMVMCLCFAFTACGDEEKPAEEHKHSYNTAEWVSDAEQHWHSASCEHADQKADVAAHEDENDDEICDVCEYNMHVHAYEETWTTDVFNHWHAATCGCEDKVSDLAEHVDADESGKCDVCEADIHTCVFNTEEWVSDETSHWYGTTCGHDKKQDEAAHTKNALGICTVCEYGADVEDAIDLGAENEDKVMNGTVTEADAYDPEAEPSVSEYDFRDGYLYVKNAYGQESYYVVVSGEIFAVSANYGDAWLDGGAILENADGYRFYGDYTGYELEFYGVADLVSGLYEMGAVDNLNGDFTEDYEDGVFTFSFGYYIEYYGLYVYNVAFTLDEETLTFKTVKLDVYRYSTDDITEVTEATEETPATWAPVENAEPTHYDVAIAQSTEKSENYDVENPYDPAKVLVSDFGVSLEIDGTTAESFEIKHGAEITLYIVGIAPETANLALATISFDADIDDIFAYCYDSTVNVSTDAAAGTVIKLTIDINGVTKTVTLTVIENVPENITAGTVVDQYGNAEVTENDSVEMTEGENTVIGAILDVKTATLTVTVDGVAVDAADLLDYNSWIDGMGYVPVYAYNASKLAAGSHTITFTCTEYPALSKTVNVTVNEKVENPDEKTINVTTTDTYGFFDYYEFVATEAGTYTFTVPAGLGLFSKELMDNNAWAPEVDFYDDGGTVVVELAAGETYAFYVGSTTKGDWEITYTVEAKVAPEINVTTTDTYSWIDEYTFTATEAGKYIFTVPAGLGVWEKNAYDHYSGAPYIDYQMESNGGTFTLELAAGETFAFYVGAFTKGDWVITYTVEAGAPVVEAIKDANGLGGEYSFNYVLNYTITVTPSAEGATTGMFTIVDPCYPQYSGTYVYTIVNGAYVFTSENIGVITDGMSWLFQNPGIKIPQAFAQYVVAENPAASLEIGANSINAEDVTFAYTATEAGTLNLSAGNAIMGEVTITYTVNGGDAATLELGTAVDLALAAGDKVVIVVKAAGYSSIQATWTASAGATSTPLNIGSNAINAEPVSFEYTATEAGNLNLSAGGAVMGMVEIYYTVNGGASQVLELSTAVDLALVAGDKVVIIVNAEGYSSIQATWTASAPAGATALNIGKNQIEAMDVTFEYTASEAGTLNLAAGGAVMGMVEVYYSVNDGESKVLELSTAVDLVLTAGDKVVITVTAEGYSTITAGWTAA